MTKQLQEYLNKALHYEEIGYAQEAVQLCNKCIQAFPDSQNEIEFEIAKINYRSGKQEEALLGFFSLYQKTRESGLCDLILELYHFDRCQEYELRYRENWKQLETYSHFFGTGASSEIRYYPILTSQTDIVYFDCVERGFEIIERCRMEREESDGKVYVARDLLWLEDLLKLEQTTRRINPFMDMENPLLLVYHEETWELLLQLVDLKQLLDFDRIVFYQDISLLEDSLVKDGIRFPNVVIGNKPEEVFRILDCAVQKMEQTWERYKAEALDYYKANGAEVVRHIKEGKPRILFITSRFTTVLQYHIRDCKVAAERLGLLTELLIEKDRLCTGMNNILCIKKIAEFKPDVIFIIDHFRTEHTYMEGLDEVVWMCWVQDKLPQSTGNKEIAEHLAKRDIIMTMFVSDLSGKQWGMNYKDALKAPVVSNNLLYKERVLSKEELECYSCDICIVANGSDYLQAIEDIIKRIPDEAKKDCRDIIAVYVDLMEQEQFVYGYEQNFRIVSFIASQLGILWNETFLKYISEEIYYFVFYTRYKSLVAEWLIDYGYTNLKLYGNGWEKYEKFRPYTVGVLENGEKLSKALCASKISIGLHPHVSLPLKAMESISSGALYIAHDIPAEFDIANARVYFKENEEFIYYYDKHDLLDKIDYYLKHEEERIKIVKAGQRRIDKELTYEKMFKRIMQETAELIERREGAGVNG